MNKFSWYANRLSLMSPMEVIFRTKETARKNFGRMTFKDFSPDISLKARYIEWYFDPNDQQAHVDFLKNSRNWNEYKAQELLKHKFSFFSLNKKLFGEKIDWQNCLTFTILDKP